MKTSITENLKFITHKKTSMTVPLKMYCAQENVNERKPEMYYCAHESTNDCTPSLAYNGSEQMEAKSKIYCFF